MQFGLDVPTTGEFADVRAQAALAAEAEAAGWDGYFVWDILLGSDEGVPVADPWITLTAVALATTRMRVGTLATPLARHRPWLVARQAATLDQLSAGRVTLTAGLGFNPRDFVTFGEPDAPAIRARALDESLAILTGLLSGGSVTHQGERYTLDGVTLSPTPVQTPRVPLWLVGGWPHEAPFRRAAHWDGVCVKSWSQAKREPLSADDLAACVAFTLTRRAELGIAAPFDICASGESPSDPVEAVAAVRPYHDAGATWWIEEGLGWTLAEFRARILAGPPHM
jgi:alkanesulfonate monooxygenase SsuD/methylene tetrahydromethanopterin reductase-like flavin-dependent oxidoreductase (luciferase family)